MNNKILYRAYQPKDHAALAAIIRETWQYDKICSPKHAKLLAGVYLNRCLTNQTYTQVAVADGVPVGIIMGKNIEKHKCPLRLWLNLMCSVILLFSSKEGRKISKIFFCVNSINDNFLQNSPFEYQGEVAFFVINSRYRGLGIGQKLFDHVKDYMRQENLQRFFLFTDTTCNYPFYEHQGMSRRGAQPHHFEVKGPLETQTLFIYDYQLS